MVELEVKDIHTFYGTSHILFGVSLEVNRGEFICLLGRNGAGKTTTLKTIMRLAPARSGLIRYYGQGLIGLPARLRSSQAGRQARGFPGSIYLCLSLNPPSKIMRNLVGDRMSWQKQSITNEVKALWHKAFFPTSTNKREPMVE